MSKKLIFPLFAVFGMAAGALAANANFHLHNNTPWEMVEVYVSPHNSNYWGDSVPNPIPAGEESYVYFPEGGNSGYYDIRVVFSNGQDVYWGRNGNSTYRLSRINDVYVSYDDSDDRFHIDID